MKRKTLRVFCMAGIVFSFINIIDLAFTLAFFSAEVNPLVLMNPRFFFMFKMLSSGVIATICSYKLLESFREDE